MITTRIRNLLIAVVCLFAGVQAKAQFIFSDLSGAMELIKGGKI